MKRLLLAPLLLAISGCSSDIVVKTDLGEKYIAKESAITVSPRSLDYLVEYIKKDALLNREVYRRCKATYRGTDRGQPYGFCERTYAFYNGFSNKHTADLNAIKLSQENSPDPIKSDQPLWYDIRFRPIFVDLNKQKNALGYEEISCLKNNYFTSVMGEKYLNLKSRQPKKMSGLAYESMKAKVCKKYAKFE